MRKKVKIFIVYNDIWQINAVCEEKTIGEFLLKTFKGNIEIRNNIIKFPFISDNSRKNFFIILDSKYRLLSLKAKVPNKLLLVRINIDILFKIEKEYDKPKEKKIINDYLYEMYKVIIDQSKKDNDDKPKEEKKETKKTVKKISKETFDKVIKPSLVKPKKHIKIEEKLKIVKPIKYVKKEIISTLKVKNIKKEIPKKVKIIKKQPKLIIKKPVEKKSVVKNVTIKVIKPLPKKIILIKKELKPVKIQKMVKEKPVKKIQTVKMVKPIPKKVKLVKIELKQVKPKKVINEVKPVKKTQTVKLVKPIPKKVKLVKNVFPKKEKKEVKEVKPVAVKNIKVNINIPKKTKVVKKTPKLEIKKVKPVIKKVEQSKTAPEKKTVLKEDLFKKVPPKIHVVVTLKPNKNKVVTLFESPKIVKKEESKKEQIKRIVVSEKKKEEPKKVISYVVSKTKVENSKKENNVTSVPPVVKKGSNIKKEVSTSSKEKTTKGVKYFYSVTPKSKNVKSVPLSSNKKDQLEKVGTVNTIVSSFKTGKKYKINPEEKNMEPVLSKKKEDVQPVLDSVDKKEKVQQVLESVVKKEESQQELNVPQTITYTIVSPDNQVMYHKEVQCGQPMTVIDLLMQTGLDINNSNGFINSINGVSNEGMSGWVFEVNNAPVMVPAGEYVMNPNEQITWKYVDFSKMYSEDVTEEKEHSRGR